MITKAIIYALENSIIVFILAIFSISIYLGFSGELIPNESIFYAGATVFLFFFILLFLISLLSSKEEEKHNEKNNS